MVRRKIDKVLISVKNKLMLKEIAENNQGMGVVEVILIILVLVGLVVIFRTKITGIVNSIFNKLTSKVNSI